MKRITLLFAFLVMSMSMALAQSQVEVSGTVISAEDNQPIIGATVRGKTSKKGDRTNIDGKFKFTVPANEKIIIVSFVGMKTQEVTVGKNLKIILQPDATTIEELVVIGYGSGKKISNTSASVVKVSSKQLEEKPIANPFDAVQGKVSGLQVYTSSGEPSELSSMKLHGTGSLGASSTPLYIVDGMPVEGSTVQSMNPNDFESFQFLKDAAATSIYGARAANGVVYITTKRGKVSDRARITVRGQYGMSDLANTSYFDKLMTSEELLSLWEEMDIKPKEVIDKIRETYKGNNYQWYKYHYQKAPTYQADMSLSGGSGMTNYYVSAGTFNQKGLRPGSEFDKINLRANLNSGLNDYVKFGLNTSVAYSKSRRSPFAGNNTSGGGIAVLAPPFYTPYDKDGNEYYDKPIPGWNRYNPKYIMDHDIRSTNNLDINLSGNVTITPFRNFTIKSQAGLELRDQRYDRLVKPSFIDAGGNGTVAKRFSRRTNISTNTTAEYKFSIAEDNHFTALIGHEYVDYGYNRYYAQGKGITDDKLTLLGHTTKDKTFDDPDESVLPLEFEEYAFLSYFGQLSYDFKERYFIDLVLRNDASSRFGKNNRNALFWSVGLLWKAKKENFMKNISWINELDVKFSTGTQGNSEIPPYLPYALVGQQGQYKGNGGVGLGEPGNENLSWEHQTKSTIAFTGRFFNRLGVNLELYNRVTSNMLMDVPMPYTSGTRLDNIGFSSITSNVGKYQNRGIDLRLDLDIATGKDYFVSAYVNMNHNKDKVLELFQGRDSWVLPGYGFGYIVGQPVVFVYPIFKGINPDNGYPEWYLPGEDIAIKTEKEVTSRFNSTLEQNTGIPLYTPTTGGFGLNAEFKGFYTQMDFAFALGKHMISNDQFFFNNPLVFSFINQSRDVMNYWKQPGQKADYPGLDYLRTVHNRSTQFDSKMIENASFMRFKNLTVGYNIPKNLISKQKVLSGAKLYITARNLLTLTKYKGMDPEVDSNLSFGANPNTRQFILGTEITF